MKKIIHLSDLHVGYDACGEGLRCIIRNIIFHKEPGTQYVVVVTGDVVETALEPANYELARLNFDALREAGFTVLAIPGNHDYGTGTLGHKKFIDHFKRVFHDVPDVEYPKVDVIEGVAFLGLDSMAAEVHWYDRLFAEGELGGPQLERLDAALASDAVRAAARRVVYLHHHPFDPWRFHELKDSEALREVLMGRGNVHALLYGHNHVGKRHNGKWGIPRCYDGGSSTRKWVLTSETRVIDLARDPRDDYDGEFYCPDPRGETSLPPEPAPPLAGKE